LKYGGNTMEIDSASLREIVKKKYGRNTMEIDYASLREIG